ncbi:hypothetical protein [Helicobacter sp. T3_23-1059]
MLRFRIKRDLLENLLNTLQARILKDTLKSAQNPRTKTRKQKLQARFIWDSLLFFSI